MVAHNSVVIVVDTLHQRDECVCCGFFTIFLDITELLGHKTFYPICHVGVFERFTIRIPWIKDHEHMVIRHADVHFSAPDDARGLAIKEVTAFNYIVFFDCFACIFSACVLVEIAYQQQCLFDLIDVISVK